jgi:hypothetical protein
VKALKMQLRRSARLLTAAGALLLAASALSSCGFNYATDRPYTPGAGTNDQGGMVDVLSAVVVSAEAGSGTLITTFSNNDDEEPATVTAIAGAGDDTALTIGDFEPIEIAPGGYVNLASDDSPTADAPVAIEGEFTPGEFVTLEFTFGDGTSSRLEVPTVTDCGVYVGLDATAETGTSPEDCEPEHSEVEH